MIGNKTEAFLKSERYDMTLDGLLIRVVDKVNGAESFVTLMSTEWFRREVEPVAAKQKKPVVL